MGTVLLKYLHKIIKRTAHSLDLNNSVTDDHVKKVYTAFNTMLTQHQKNKVLFGSE